MFGFVAWPCDPAIWAACEPILARALAHARDGQTIADVRDALDEDDAQLWCGPDAAAVTRRWSDCVEIWLCGGSQWQALREVIEAAGRADGARRVQGTGRLGWQRVLADAGYHQVAVTMEKAL